MPDLGIAFLRRRWRRLIGFLGGPRMEGRSRAAWLVCCQQRKTYQRKTHFDNVSETAARRDERVCKDALSMSRHRLLSIAAHSSSVYQPRHGSILLCQAGSLGWEFTISAAPVVSADPGRFQVVVPGDYETSSSHREFKVGVCFLSTVLGEQLYSGQPDPPGSA